MARANLEGVDDLDNACDQEVGGEQEGEGEEAGERMEDEIAAGEEIEGAKEELPEKATPGMGFEGHDEVGDATDEDGPADEEGNGDSGDGWDENGEETRQNEKNAEGDGPVDGCAGDVAERSGAGHAHEVQSSERCRYLGVGVGENGRRAADPE